jgi:hypothetical protein
MTSSISALFGPAWIPVVGAFSAGSEASSRTSWNTLAKVLELCLTTSFLGGVLETLVDRSRHLRVPWYAQQSVGSRGWVQRPTRSLCTRGRLSADVYTMVQVPVEDTFGELVTGNI